MRNFKIHLAAIMMVLGLGLSAQQIQITIIPGSEYTYSRRDEWKVVVNNTTNQTLRVFFYGLATEAQKGKVYETRSLDRDIPPGSTTFSTQYYVGLQPFNTLYEDQSLRQYAVQTNGLPAGDYEICITAYLQADSSELGTSCFSFTVDHFTPPIPILPENNDTICDKYPFFSWLPPVPNNGQNFTYTLSIYEVQYMQTVFSAVQTNPAFYEKKGIATPIVQYGINARNFRAGQRYAWRVSAEVNNQTVAASEVWSFIFCNPGLLITTDSTKKKEEVKNTAKPGVPYLVTSGELKNSFSTLDRNLLSFLYVHSSNTPAVGMRILDTKGTMVFSKRLDVAYGNNYFSAPLNEYNQLKTNELYELQIVDMNGAIKKLRFKVKP
ncbi:MAG TPA: hypothetical protein VK174_01695 [Chitinophagales bacterium]|nr:hypothetical protein [Chitinophagales bacterium]